MLPINPIEMPRHELQMAVPGLIQRQMTIMRRIRRSETPRE